MKVRETGNTISIVANLLARGLPVVKTASSLTLASVSPLDFSSLSGISTNLDLEICNLDRIPLLLGSDKHTFIFDIDETLIMWKHTDRTKPPLYPEMLDAHAIRFYPSSPALPLVLSQLYNCGQGIGLVTNGTRLPSHLAALKTFGVDLRNVDFIAVPDIREEALYKSYDTVVPRLNEMYGVKPPCPVKFEDFLKYLQDTYGVRLVHFPYIGGTLSEVESYKPDAIEEVSKLGSSDSRIDDILHRPFIAVGNKDEDVILAYPESYHIDYMSEEGGLGVVVSDQFKHFDHSVKARFSTDAQDFFKKHTVHSLGRVICCSIANIQTLAHLTQHSRTKFLEDFDQVDINYTERHINLPHPLGGSVTFPALQMSSLTSDEYVSFCRELTGYRRN